MRMVTKLEKPRQKTTQQDTERHPAILPGPEQDQREAIARQGDEDHFFDTPHTMQETQNMDTDDFEEDKVTAVAAQSN